VVGVGRDLSYQIVALPHAPWHPAPGGCCEHTHTHTLTPAPYDQPTEREAALRGEGVSGPTVCGGILIEFARALLLLLLRIAWYWFSHARRFICLLESRPIGRRTPARRGVRLSSRWPYSTSKSSGLRDPVFRASPVLSSGRVNGCRCPAGASGGGKRRAIAVELAPDCHSNSRDGLWPDRCRYQYSWSLLLRWWALRLNIRKLAGLPGPGGDCPGLKLSRRLVGR